MLEAKEIKAVCEDSNPLQAEASKREHGDLQGRRVSGITKASAVIGVVLVIVGVVVGSALLAVIGILLALYSYYKYRSETRELEVQQDDGQPFPLVGDSQGLRGGEYVVNAFSVDGSDLNRA